MSFCLVPEIANKFLSKLKSGEINPKDLNNMTSKERHAFFSEMMGEENAANTNALFESKLLLKNQQNGFINWAKQVAGLKPEIQRDIISRINKLDHVLNPAEEKSFLEDLAAQKLGTSVTLEEATKISELAKKAEETRQAALEGKDRMAYGRARVELVNYLSDLKNESKKVSFEEIKKNPGRSLMSGIKDVSGLAKSLKASLDNSALFRQGLKSMFTHPNIWLKNSLKSFKDIWNTFGGKETMDEVKADVYSRPNALNGLYKKEKLAVGIENEEAFPTRFPEKIPGLGRAFKASDNAYSGFSMRMRADIFDKYVEMAKASGGDIEGIGKLVNSLTGRGDVGALERASDALNNVFFSPRFLKSNIDLLTAHYLDKNISPFARKQAAINLVKVVGGIAGILTVANAVKPGSVETDPRSSDFGKIKIGNTRFDVSGGMSSLVTLASRLATRSTKSSVSGEVKDLDTGKFASPTSGDVVINFFNNKLSPAASIVRDLMNGIDRSGNPITVGGELANAFAPLPITNYLELKNDPNSANNLIALLADSLGISTNTYSKNSFKKKHKSLYKENK